MTEEAPESAGKSPGMSAIISIPHDVNTGKSKYHGSGFRCMSLIYNIPPDYCLISLSFIRPVSSWFTPLFFKCALTDVSVLGSW